MNTIMINSVDVWANKEKTENSVGSFEVLNFVIEYQDDLNFFNDKWLKDKIRFFSETSPWSFVCHL